MTLKLLRIVIASGAFLMLPGCSSAPPGVDPAQEKKQREEERQRQLERSRQAYEDLRRESGSQSE